MELVKSVTGQGLPGSSSVDGILFFISYGETIKLTVSDDHRLCIDNYIIGKSPRYLSRLVRLVLTYGSRFGCPTTYYDLTHPIWCHWHSDWRACNCGAFDEQ